MNSFVDLEIFGSGKNFSTAWKGTRERLLSGVDPNVVDQLVLCLEGPELARAVLPEASVVRDLGSSDVFDREVSDNFVKAAENCVAGLSGRRHFRIDPEASHLLLDGLSEVAVEGSGGSVMSCHAGHAVHVGGVHLVGRAHLVLRPVGHSGQSAGLHRIVEAGERVRSGRVKSGGEHGVTSGGRGVMGSSGVDMERRDVAPEHRGVRRRVLASEVAVLAVGHLGVHAVGRRQLEGSGHGCALYIRA